MKYNWTQIFDNLTTLLVMIIVGTGALWLGATIWPVTNTTTTQAATAPSGDALLEAIIATESGGRWDAVGDNGAALGILQIHKIMVDDCNRIYQLRYKTGKQPFTYKNRSNPSTSTQMFWLFTNHYTKIKQEHPDWAETVARKWNGGPQGHKKAATLKYWQKVKTKIIQLSKE